MSLLRYDLATNDWVIFAPERTQRPHDIVRGVNGHDFSEAAINPCPFCPGNESMTGPTIDSVRGHVFSNQSDWKVRVISNKYPALRIEEETRRFQESSVFRHMGGCGAHEVIIESPDHDRILAEQPVEHIQLLITQLKNRFNDLLGDRRFQTIVIFKNHGERAGTSLRHPHFQLIATPVVPQLLRIKHRIATDYFDQNGQSLYQVLLEEELKLGDRIIAENSDYAAMCPYASHVPFETWICPKRQEASFGNMETASIGKLSEILKTVLRKLFLGLDNPDFNLTINTSPRGDEFDEAFLWHLQILPRLTTPAGFEMGSGMSINPILPEEAATFLRSIDG